MTALRLLTDLRERGVRLWVKVSGRYQSAHLCGRLEIDTIEEIGREAQSSGFAVVE